MIRRMVFACAIIFLQTTPQLSIVVLMVTSMAILAFTVMEKPWKEAEMNFLAIANEVFLYILIVL